MRCEFEHFNEPRSRHTDNDAVHRHVLAGYLQPTTRSSTQVDATSCALEERELLVQLDELERRTGSVALLSNGRISIPAEPVILHTHFASL